MQTHYTHSTPRSVRARSAHTVRVAHTITIPLRAGVGSLTPCLPGRTCDARSTDRQSLDMGVSEAVVTLFSALMLYATVELTGLVRRLTKHFLKAESWMQSVHELARNPLAEAAAAAPASGKQSVRSGVTPWTYG